MRTIDEWVIFIENAPEQIKNETLEYWSNVRNRYNNQEPITKENMDELSKVMKACDILGISSKEFLNYSKRRNK